MLMKAMMGVMPELNPIKMIADILGAPPAAGWVMHFLIGTVLWGRLFAWLDPTVPGESHRPKGIVFAAGTWLIMMIAMMPMAGAGLFGAHLGMTASVMTLMLHIIFRFVLGAVYALERPDPTHEFQGMRT
jgi:hypothetical protein